MFPTPDILIPVIRSASELTSFAWAIGRSMGDQIAMRVLEGLYGESAAHSLYFRTGLVDIKLEKELRPYLLRIAQACPLGPFENLKIATLQENPAGIAEIAERYGPAFNGVSNFLGQSLCFEEPAVREALQKIIAVIPPGDINGALPRLDRYILSALPNGYIQYLELCESEHSKNILYLPAGSFLNNTEKCLALAALLKEHTWGAFSSLEEEALDFYLSEEGMQVLDFARKQLGEDFDHLLGDVLAALNNDPADAEEMIQRLKDASSGSPESLAELLTLQNVGTETFQPILRRFGTAAEDLFNNFPAILTTQQPAALFECARFCHATFDRVSEVLPYQLLTTHPQEMINLFKEFGNTTWGLLSRFGEKVLEVHGRTREVAKMIAYHSSESGGFIFHYLAEEEWESKGLPLAAKYQQAAGRLLDHKITAETLESAAYVTNYQHFGIRNFQRLLLDPKTPQPDILLRENLKNLNPNYAPKKPVALFFMGHSDHNEASMGIAFQLSLLIHSHRLMIFEIGSRTEFRQAQANIREILTTSLGDPRAVAFGAMCVHGFETEMELNVGPEIKDKTIRLQDAALFSSLGEFFINGSRFILDSCSLFRGGDGAQNLGSMVGRKMPHVEVTGIRIPSAQGGFVFNDQFEPIGMDFTVPASKIVTTTPHETGDGILHLPPVPITVR